jgi:glyoxylate reductase
MNRKPTVYVTRDLTDLSIDRLVETCSVHAWPDTLPPSYDHIKRRVAELEANALLCMLPDDVDAEIMDSSPSLDVISTLSVGYDHIDIEAAHERDIAIGHTPGVLSETTADLAWSLLMACARRTLEAQAYVSDDRWETWGPTVLTGRDVHDATLGIFGLGKIGRAVARRGAGFNMDVLYAHTSRNPDAETELEAAGIEATYVELDELLERSNFVSLHVPLNKDTHGLIGERELALMGSNSILINTSRGEVVDSSALDEALESDRIYRAGLDVTDPEPLPGDHELLRHVPEKLVVTPHIGSASVPTRTKMARMASENILAALGGDDPPYSALEDAGLC